MHNLAKTIAASLSDFAENPATKTPFSPEFEAIP
jgi:hypothetical protein